MSVYATGTSGTIGRHLSGGIKSVRSNFLDPNFLSDFPVFDRNDSIIHLGGIVGVDNVAKNIEVSHLANVEATRKIAEKFIRENGKYFLYVSSSHVYENSSVKLTESSNLRPQSDYANQKLEAEKVLMKLFALQPERLCIARVFSILDWGTAPFTLGGGISRLIEDDSNYKLLNSDDIRDFLTPRTVANTLQIMATKRKLSGVVNLCTGIGMTVGEAARKMIAIRGYSIPSDRIINGISNVPYLVGDNSKIASQFPELILQWQPSKE